MDYPHDHVDGVTLRKRLQALQPLEQQVIADKARIETNGRNYYLHCFDSLTPISQVQNHSVLNKYHDYVYLGVHRYSNGDCEGCPLNKSIHYDLRNTQIRKFVGNREVFNIITNEHRFHFSPVSSIAQYPPNDAPFEVTAVTVASYRLSILLYSDLLDYSCSLKYCHVGQVVMSSLFPRPERNNKKRFKWLDLFISLIESLPSSIRPHLQCSLSICYEILVFGIYKLRISWYWIWTWCSLVTCIQNYNDYPIGWNEVVEVWLFFHYSSSVVLKFFNTVLNWKTVYHCIILSFFSFSNIPLIPHNKTDLIQCLDTDVCNMRTRYSRTHVWRNGFEWMIVVCDAIMVWSKERICSVSNGMCICRLSRTVSFFHPF